MKKFAYASFALVSYGLGMASITGLMLFLLGLESLPWLSVNGGEVFFAPLLLNTLLVCLFALQHTLMARQGFKKALQKYLPKTLERSVYVLASSLCLGLVLLAWQPIAGVVWQVENPAGRLALFALYAVGWSIVFASTFQIDHWELFGLRQVFDWMRNKHPQAANFVTPWMYRIVRHPMMAGMLLLLWSTPEMSLGHACFSAMFSVYVLIGIRFEEKDLEEVFADKYHDYKKVTPALLPRAKTIAGKLAVQSNLRLKRQ